MWLVINIILEEYAASHVQGLKTEMIITVPKIETVLPQTLLTPTGLHGITTQNTTIQIEIGLMNGEYYALRFVFYMTQSVLLGY
jgi:hypothetical protein